jgi:hypothetical protein
MVHKECLDKRSKQMFKDQVAFQHLENEIQKIGIYTPLGYALNAVHDSARVNADDTIYVEKSAPQEDWGKIAISSLENLLSFCSDKAVCDWYEAHGIRW